ncbi:MAG: hypothetical protein K0Q72_5075, partial [Armatimonadetes bacterium]|nr:hypothetical protein [Armatimonadota bacterium]
QVRTLVAGEEVRVAPELFTEAEQKRLVRSVARRGWPAEQEETDEDDDPRTLLNLDYLRRYGLGVRVDRDGSEEGGAKLTMVFAPPGQSFSTFTVGIFPDQDLGQPLTRSNPFRDLEQRVPRRLPVAQLSARLREPLGAPLVVPSGASWRMALAAFTKASGLPVASDDYLCRVVSFPPAQGEPVLSVDRGVPTAEALDRMCEAYRYLWWEMDGCCYFRSRCWPRDMETEVPPRVVEQLAGTLQRQGQLGAEEIVAVFHLTKRQLGGLFRLGISGAGPNGFINPSLPGFLRWFAGLPPAHQAAIVGEGATVIVNDSSMLPGVTRKMLGEPLWVHLQQAATRIPAKNPLGWRLALTLQTAPAGNSTQASSSFYNLNVPNPDAEPAPAGVGSEPEPPQ